MSRPLLTLFAAKTFSDFGFALDYICINTFIWMKTGSPFTTGLLVAALYGGGAIGGRIAQLYGDQWNRRHAMVCADFLRMVMLVILAFLPDPSKMFWIYPTVLMIGIGRAIFESTLAASLPAMAGSKLQLVNSFASGLKGGALVLGMSFAALATQKLGFEPLFLLDALSYGISGVVLWSISLQFREEKTIAISPTPRPHGEKMVYAFGFGIWLLLIVRGLDALGSGTHHVGLPMLGSALNSADPAQAFGFLWAVWGIGMLIGSFLIRPALARVLEKSPQNIFFIATAVMSSGFIGIFWAPTWISKLACALLAGLGDGLSEIAFKQSLQRTSDAIRGGLFGLTELIVNSGLIVGIFLTGSVATPQSIGLWVLLLHGIPVCAAIGCSLSLFKRVPRLALSGNEKQVGY